MSGSQDTPPAIAAAAAAAAAPRIACVTGAASGIGQAVARRLLADGLRRFVLVDQAGAALQPLAHAIAAAGGEASTLVLDVADDGRVVRELTHAAEQLGGMHVLVHSAGMGMRNTLAEADKWFRTVAVNLHGAYSVTRALVPFMDRGSRIVHVGSVLGVVGLHGHTAYAAAKHGVLGLCRSLALDLAPQGITVNAVLPAWVDTPMLQAEMRLDAARLGQPCERMRRTAQKTIPLRRFIQPDEVAHAVAFLCSPLAAGITGQRLVIDGGTLRGA